MLFVYLDLSFLTRGKLSTKNIILLIRNTTYTGIRKDKKVFLTPFILFGLARIKYSYQTKQDFQADLIDWLPL